jgi:hypothetical protein
MKAEREAARAERKAEREAAKAEREALRDEKKAELEAARDARAELRDLRKDALEQRKQDARDLRAEARAAIADLRAGFAAMSVEDRKATLDEIRGVREGYQDLFHALMDSWHVERDSLLPNTLSDQPEETEGELEPEVEPVED